MRALRLGFFCLPGLGHLNPSHALGRRLVARGHTVICFQSTRARAAVRAAGLEWCPIETGTFDPHYLSAQIRTRQAIAAQSAQSLAAIERVRDARLDALVIDHADLGAGSVAERLGLPFVSLAFSPPFYLDDRVPPPIASWSPSTSQATYRRNARANRIVERAVAPALATVNETRRQWTLSPLERLKDTFSTRALITQLPSCFDFAYNYPPNLIHAGLFGNSSSGYVPDFPWDRLDGRPLIYASRGTVRNAVVETFRQIARVCAFDTHQVVISLGGRFSVSDLGDLPKNVIAVHYAPQLALLQRAAAMVTHGGLNSTLEALACGVPLVVIPVTDDQPGVAARVRAHGVGRVIPARALTAARLRRCLRDVLQSTRYRDAARRLGERLTDIDGAGIAAVAIEQALGWSASAGAAADASDASVFSGARS